MEARPQGLITLWHFGRLEPEDFPEWTLLVERTRMIVPRLGE